MNNRVSFQETILDQLRNNPVKGKALLTIYLKNPTTLIESKLHLMALLLAQFGENMAAIVVPYLPVNPKAIPDPLATLTLNHVLVNNLIDLLSRKKYKLLREQDKGQLYFNLSQTAIHLIKEEETILSYLGKAAGYFDDLAPLERHFVHYNLGLRYAISDQENSALHFKAAINLEKKNKALFQSEDQIRVLAIIFDFYDSIPFESGDQQYFLLTLLISLEPQDPRLIKAISDYLDKSLFSAHPPALSSRYLAQFFYFQQIYPDLKARFQPLGELLRQLPEEVCSIDQKLEYFYIMNQYEQVIELAQVVLQKNEYEYSALIRLAGSLWQRKRTKEAIDYYKKALLCPLILKDKLHVLYQLSSLHNQSGNYVHAKEYDDALIALDPDCFYAKIRKAQNAFFLGNRQKSKKIFLMLLTQYPDRAKDIQSNLNMYFGDANKDFDRDADLSFLSFRITVNQMKGNYAAAEAIGLFLLSIDPSDSITMLRLANVYEAQGRWDECVKLHLSLNEREQGRYSFELASDYWMLEQYESAEQYIWSFLRDPNSHSKETVFNREKALKILLFIYRDRHDDLKNKISSLSNKLEDSSHFLSNSEKRFIHLVLAILYRRVDPLKEVDEIKKALLCQEEVHSDFNKILGLYYYYSDRKAEALVFLNKALLASPDDTEILFALGAALYTVDPSQKQKALSSLSTVLIQNPSKLSDIVALPLSEEDSNVLLGKFALKEKNESEAAEEKDSSDEEVEEKKPAFSLSREALIPLSPSLSPVLTPEQIEHRYFQDLKKQLKASLLEHKDSKESGWHLPSGFLSVNDPRVFKVAIAQHLRAESCLYAFIDLDALRETCPEDLLSRWQMLLEEGKVVRNKKRQRGIVFFNQQRAAKTGFAAQLKMLGLYNDARARAKLVPGSENIQLLHFDTAVLKAH